MHSLRWRRPAAHLAAVLAIGAVAAGCSADRPEPTTTTTPTSAPSASDVERVGTWGIAQDSTRLSLSDQTIRNIVHTSVGGSRLQVSLSNVSGSVPVTFDSVWVGRSAGGASVVAGSNRRLTFSGSEAVTVPVGDQVVSDPLPGEIAAQTTLAVSIHVLGRSGTVTGQNLTPETNWISAPGDHSGEETGSNFTRPTNGHAWVGSVLVEAPRPVDTVVALGDSITVGAHSTLSANRRWTDYLADRLLTQKDATTFGVMNAGIVGNRVLANGSGASALSRFDRDVLDQPDVRTVILLEGTNDLRLDLATASTDLISAYRQLISRAHGEGVCIVGGTITPWQGGNRWSASRDAIRIEVNDWIRTSGEFDAVVDFDATIRDPRAPSRLLPAYDSGDHLHPGDAGYEAMANAVDLKALECTR